MGTRRPRRGAAIFTIRCDVLALFGFASRLVRAQLDGRGVFWATAELLAESPRTTRYRHTATILESGEVLVIGGTEGGQAINLVDLYE